MWSIEEVVFEGEWELEGFHGKVKHWCTVTRLFKTDSNSQGCVVGAEHTLCITSRLVHMVLKLHFLKEFCYSIDFNICQYNNLPWVLFCTMLQLQLLSMLLPALPSSEEFIATVFLHGLIIHLFLYFCCRIRNGFSIMKMLHWEHYWARYAISCTK